MTLKPSKSAGLRWAAQQPRHAMAVFVVDVSRVSRLLRHGTRSPADLLGTGGLYAQSISSTIQVSGAARRACALHAAQFRRQVPIDRYIVDYLAPAVKLVVEVDGGIHAARRDRTLERLGYRVLRIDAELVRGNVAEAVALIVTALGTV